MAVFSYLGCPCKQTINKNPPTQGLWILDPVKLCLKNDFDTSDVAAIDEHNIFCGLDEGCCEMGW